MSHPDKPYRSEEISPCIARRPQLDPKDCSSPQLSSLEGRFCEKPPMPPGELCPRSSLASTDVSTNTNGRRDEDQENPKVLVWRGRCPCSWCTQGTRRSSPHTLCGCRGPMRPSCTCHPCTSRSWERLNKLARADHTH